MDSQKRIAYNQKLPKKKKPKKEEKDIDLNYIPWLYITDISPSKYDVWGDPIQDNEDKFKDSFEKAYVDIDSPTLR